MWQSEKGRHIKKHFTNLSATLQTIFILSEKIIFQTELRSMLNGYGMGVTCNPKTKRDPNIENILIR